MVKAVQAEQIKQIKQDKCRSSGSCMREPNQIIYYNLWMTKSVQNYRSYIKTIKMTLRYLNKYFRCYRIGRNACKCFVGYLYFFIFLFIKIKKLYDKKIISREW